MHLHLVSSGSLLTKTPLTTRNLVGMANHPKITPPMQAKTKVLPNWFKRRCWRSSQIRWSLASCLSTRTRWRSRQSSRLSSKHPYLFRTCSVKTPLMSTEVVLTIPWILKEEKRSNSLTRRRTSLKNEWVLWAVKYRRTSELPACYRLAKTNKR